MFYELITILSIPIFIIWLLFLLSAIWFRIHDWWIDHKELVRTKEIKNIKDKIKSYQKQRLLRAITRYR